MSYDPDDDIDLLLRQVNAVLDDSPVSEQEPEEEPVRNYSNNYGRGPVKQAPAPSHIPAYNPDYEAACRLSGYDARYDESEEYTQGYEEDDDQSYDDYEPVRKRSSARKEKPVKHKKKRGCGCLTSLIMLAVVIAAGFFLFHSFVKPPKTDKPIGTRKDEAATILLCGTDMEGTRTDTMMLMYVNAKEGEVNLVSLPRDTLTHTTSGSTAKLNSAFGRNNGGEDPVEGMENLMLYVEDIIGYRPDGYMLVNLQGFVEIVDAMGGVKFDVPQDMYYEDSSQDLYIDLQEGMQKLNGYDAMCLVRFRKGYADQDLGRVSVQREFISSCMDQWAKPTNIVKLPKVLSVLGKHSTTDLTTGNMLWLAVNAWKAGFSEMKMETLPGYADMIDGGSYYILYPSEVADLIDSTCNPYEKTITREDLTIYD